MALSTSAGTVGKPALGRGLGNLMKGATVAASPAVPAAKTTSLSPGMATLLHGAHGLPKAEQRSPRPPTDPPPASAAGHRRLRISLLVADALLLGLAARLAYRSAGAFSFAETGLSVLAILMGAWLGYQAISLE